MPGRNTGTVTSGATAATSGVWLGPELIDWFFFPIRHFTPDAFPDDWCITSAKLAATGVSLAFGWIFGGGASYVANWLSGRRIAFKVNKRNDKGLKLNE